MLCFLGDTPRPPYDAHEAYVWMRAVVARHTSRFSVRTRTSCDPDPLPPVVACGPRVARAGQ
ncbi:hypothetical protein GCM10009654_62220 [Streptomyces hebeiensis]|uniref:Uncharacterized protein n=1 Tax=Streptomyces hebeiensis TaxID=229486 RepID=A0ABP4FV28_9ACTN